MEEQERTDEQESRREAREHWRKARDEMREAFRQAWKAGGLDDKERRQEIFEDFVQEVADKAKEFANTVSGEARRFGGSVAGEARKHADEAWKGVREDWQHRNEERRHRRWEERQAHWLFGGRRFQHWAGGDEEANPFLAAMMSKGGGLLSVYVLHLLAEKPRHGNDLMKEIERRTLGGWTSNPGAVYPLLSSMESNGLVSSSWEEPDKRTRRIYQITDQGREELTRLKQMLRPKLMDTIDVLHDMFDDLYASGGPDRPGTTDKDEDTPAQPEAEETGDQSQTPPDPSVSSLVHHVRRGVRTLLDRIVSPNPGHAAQASL